MSAAALIIIKGQVSIFKKPRVMICTAAIEPKKLDIVKIKDSRVILIALRKLRAMGAEIPADPWITPPTKPTGIDNRLERYWDSTRLGFNSFMEMYRIVEKATITSNKRGEALAKMKVPKMHPKTPEPASRVAATQFISALR